MQPHVFILLGSLLTIVGYLLGKAFLHLTSKDPLEDFHPNHFTVPPVIEELCDYSIQRSVYTPSKGVLVFTWKTSISEQTREYTFSSTKKAQESYLVKFVKDEYHYWKQNAVALRALKSKTTNSERIDELEEQLTQVKQSIANINGRITLTGMKK